MIMTISMVANRNAMGDSYKNIVNAFRNKSDIICVIPGAYSIDEFSAEFRDRIIEGVMNEKYKFFNALLLIRKIRNLIQQYKIQKIFIYFDNSWFNILLLIFLYSYRLTYIVWVHDPILHLGEGKKEKFIRSLNAKLFFNHVDRFIVSYKEAVYDLSEKYKIDATKIFSIRLPRMAEMEYPFSNEKNDGILFDFIFFGRIEEYKGIDLLVDVVKDMKNIKLLIVGKGQMEHIIKEKVSICDNIVFINEYLPNEKLARKIIQSKWVILPYKTATGSQIVQIANFYGKPVLATKVGCFKEYIVNGRNGYFIETYSYESFYRAICGAITCDYSVFKHSLEDELEKFEIHEVVKSLEEIICKA